MKTNRLFALGLMMAVAGGACGGDDGGKPTQKPDGGNTITLPDGAMVTVNPDGGGIPGADSGVDGGGDQTGPDGAIIGGSGSKLITAAGGSVTSADGRLTVTFSRYAFTRPTTVTISVLTPAPAGAVGTVYDIEPKQEQLGTVANVTVSVKLKYNASDLGGGSPQDLKVGQYSFGRWQELTGIQYNAASQTKANPSAMEIVAFVTKLGPVALLPGLCIDCPEAACNPDTCVTGSDMVKGKCVTTGNGCSVCRPTCDNDNDGFCISGSSGGDCNDGDAKINSQAIELCNGVDDNCNNHVDEGCKACGSDTDCTESFEACINGFCDTNGCGSGCNATNCFQQGQTGVQIAGRCRTFGTNSSCDACVPACDMDGDGQCPTADDLHGIQGGDCNDADPKVKSGGTEICGNNVDDDCNGFVDDYCNACTTDADCPINGLVCLSGACAGCSTAACDATACGVNGAANGQAGHCATIGKGCNVCVPNCDGDNDGYCPGNGGDCDDSNPAIRPSSNVPWPDLCGNGIDDNCNGHKDEGCTGCSADSDCKAGLESCSNGACQICQTCDAASCAFPMYATMGVKTVPGTCHSYGTGCSVCVPPGDTDGDGFITQAQATKVATDSMVTLAGPYDCDDSMATVNPNAPELCGNMVDDNCNTKVDELCTPCASSAMCGAPGACDNTR